MSLNLRSTHRATTAMRAAFMSAKLPAIEQADKVMPTWEKICNAADRGFGLYNRPNVSLDVTGKTFKMLRNEGAIVV